MELRQLEYLVAVVEERSFTRAAARVRVAQPAVSAQIGRLERELGHRLLDRSGREVTPTAVGAAVLPYARPGITGGALETSTVDIATEFTNLLQFERGYQANSKVITTEDDVIQTTLGLITS